MTSKKSEQQQAAKPDLATNYRPLGLKAVAAASMMAKPAPVKKLASFEEVDDLHDDAG